MGGRRRRVRLNGLLSERARGRVVLRHRDDGPKRERVTLLRRDSERPVDVGQGLVHAADRQEQPRPVREHAWVRNGVRDRRGAGQGGGEVTPPRFLDGAADKRRPGFARTVGEVARPHVQDGRVVEGPCHRIGRPRHDRPQHRGLPGLRGGGLPRHQGQRALRVLGEDPPLPDGDSRLDRVDLDLKLGSFDRPVHERRRDPEPARRAAEEVNRTGQQVDPGTGSVGRGSKGDRGVLVEPHHAAVAQDYGRPAERSEPHGVTQAVNRAQSDRKPLRLSGTAGFDPTLGGDGSRHPVFTIRRGS